MKIRIKIAILALLFVTAAAMAVGAVKSIAAHNDANTPPTIVSNASAENTNAEYYLRDCSGYVAVFKGKNSPTPVEITEIETETLNSVDRGLLKQGIPAQSKSELLMLLEDFSS